MLLSIMSMFVSFFGLCGENQKLRLADEARLTEFLEKRKADRTHCPYPPQTDDLVFSLRKQAGCGGNSPPPIIADMVE